MNFPYPSCSVSSPPAMALSATTGVTKSSRMSRPTTTSCHGAVSSWMPRKKKETMRGALMAIALHATIDHFPTLSHKEAQNVSTTVEKIDQPEAIIKRQRAKKKGWELGSNGISQGYDESRHTTIAPTNRHFATAAKKPKQTTERQQTYCLGGK